VEDFSGWLDGSSTTDANSTARLTGNGSRAHQWRISFGCAPIYGILSYAEAPLISGSGSDTSMSFSSRLLYVY